MITSPSTGRLYFCYMGNLEAKMGSIVTILYLIVAPVLAIYIGCVGVETIDENPLGWLLLAIGVGYPPGAVIVFRRRRTRVKK